MKESEKSAGKIYVRKVTVTGSKWYFALSTVLGERGNNKQYSLQAPRFVGQPLWVSLSMPSNKKPPRNYRKTLGGFTPASSGDLAS